MTTTSQRETPPRDSVLSRFMLGFDGVELSAELTDYLAGGLSGVALYARNLRSPKELRELTGAIRSAAGHPVLIGIDQEGGTRFALKEPFTVWPSAEQLGRTGDVELISQVATAMALELAAVGCNLNFAPMLDLNINPESPVTKDRSLGADPGVVARMGVAFHAGLREGGVLSCAKHFPGHGDAVVDPHLDLPVFHGTMKRLNSSELVPFAAAIAASVPLIMTAHILLPEVDPEQPASLSRKMLDEVLRRHMGFQGVVLADDLGMGAIAREFGPGDAAVRTLQAGTDIAMLCHNWSAVGPAIAAVRRARDDGRFDEAEWRTSCERIERALVLAESDGPQPPLEIIGCAEHRSLASKIRVHRGA